MHKKKKSKYYLGITKQQLADDCDNKGDDKKKERKNVDLFQNGFYFFFLHHKNITVVFEKTINRGFLRADKNTEHVPTFLKVQE